MMINDCYIRINKVIIFIISWGLLAGEPRDEDNFPLLNFRSRTLFFSETCLDHVLNLLFRK